MAPRSKVYKRTRKNFSDDQKKQLALLAKKYPALWNAADENYMKRDFVASIWDTISKQVELSVLDCKILWKSLRDALNYRCKVVKQKSGDSATEELDENDEETSSSHVQESLEAWPLWESLKFLVENKPTHNTYRITSTSVESDKPSKDNQLILESSPEVVFVKEPTNILKRPSSSYDYMQEKRYKDTNSIAAGISQLVDLRKQSLKPKQKELKYESIYINLDRMLCKLPETVVEDLNLQFVTLTYAEIKKISNHS